MSEWHHHHEGDDTIMFCALSSANDWGVDSICSGRIWRGGQWVACHYRLVWREDVLSSDVGAQVPLFVHVEAVSDGADA